MILAILIFAAAHLPDPVSTATWIIAGLVVLAWLRPLIFAILAPVDEECFSAIPVLVIVFLLSRVSPESLILALSTLLFLDILGSRFSWIALELPWNLVRWAYRVRKPMQPAGYSGRPKREEGPPFNREA